jgi:germination protein M
VDFAETAVLQARRILEAQLAPPAAPLVSAIPEGTRLKNIYVSDAGIAFVDLSGEISSRHPGGSLGEILTVYSVVSALTENLPAITGVQMLIDGRQVETLAGHIDLRRPLEKTDRWIEPATDSPPAGATQDTAARTSVVR